MLCCIKLHIYYIYKRYVHFSHWHNVKSFIFKFQAYKAFDIVELLN